MSNTYFKAMSVMGCEIGDITRRSLCRHNCCDGENCVTWLEKQFAKLNEYEEVKAEGRLVVLPPPEESDYEGLKVKYRVYKAKDNTPVENCFVLRPEKDLAAVAALTAYAHATDNKQLAEDILNWITPDERVKVLPETGIGDLSDGYHTFNELYHHRAILFSVICNEHPDISWKSKLHYDGTMFDGMFIVGINTPEGQATYHYDINPYWDIFRVRELEKAPEWDGHTSEQAIERIASLTREALAEIDKQIGCGQDGN